MKAGARDNHTASDKDPLSQEGQSRSRPSAMTRQRRAAQHASYTLENRRLIKRLIHGVEKL